MATRFTVLYAGSALVLIVWATVRPAGLPLLLLVGLGIVAGLHALDALDVRRGSGGQGIDQHVAEVRSRHADGSPH